MPATGRINEILYRELSAAIPREVFFPEGLITITSVDCSSDMGHARAYVSVLPDRLTGTALRALQKSSVTIMKSVAGRLKFRRIPKLSWSFDPVERDYEKMDKVFQEID
jgi:ribosome-binding factor A